jgi:RhtB (resistance to homoserine/threonine) family protein
LDFLHNLILLTTIHLLAAATPGPDFILISKQTLSYGKRAGYLTALGIALGLSIHILYSSLGLATLIAHSTTALMIIKVLGGSYLIYIGYNALKSNSSVIEPLEIKKDIKNSKHIVVGFLGNLFNPKAPIYFLALFTLVLSPNMPMWQLLFYGVWLMILQFIWFAFVVTFLTIPKINKKFQEFSHYIEKLLGGVLIILGIKIIFSKN